MFIALLTLTTTLGCSGFQHFGQRKDYEFLIAIVGHMLLSLTLRSRHRLGRILLLNCGARFRSRITGAFPRLGIVLWSLVVDLLPVLRLLSKNI